VSFLEKIREPQNIFCIFAPRKNTRYEKRAYYYSFINNIN